MRIGSLEIEHIHEDGHRRIKLVGDLDLVNVEQVREFILRADDGVQDLILDTTDLAFIDTNGLHTLIAAREHYGQRFTLIAGERTRRILEITGLHDIFGLDGA